MRRTAILVILLPLACPAWAQHFTDVAQQLDAADRQGAWRQARLAPVRVQVNYQLIWPSADKPSVDDQKSAILAAHTALYDLAGHECERLKAISSDDCKLVAIQVSNSAQPMRPEPVMQVSASATFDLTPQPPSLPPAGSTPEQKP